MTFKPILAETATDDHLKTMTYPVLVSPKLDGIRCILKDGLAVSRTLKPIPNVFIRSKLEALPLPIGVTLIDGELLAGDKFNECSGNIMRRDGEPEFVYHVFDLVMEEKFDMPFAERFGLLNNLVREWNVPFVKLVPHKSANSYEELQEIEAQHLANGHEGAMSRSVFGRYKLGRSTLRENILLKIKRFSQSEAKVVGYERKYQNNNEATVDFLGHTKRSSHQENLVPLDELGMLTVEDLKTGIRFGIGSGFTQELREKLWEERNSLEGRIVTYKYFAFNVLEAPRFPVFVGFRHEDDM